MHAKLELCEGRLRPTDSQAICKTIALLAQAEFGDCDDSVALVQFFTYWCEHLGASKDDDEFIIDHIQNLQAEMKVCVMNIFILIKYFLSKLYKYIIF